MNDITLKISIDGTEATATIQNVDGLLDDLRSKASASGKTDPFTGVTQAAKNLQSELMALGGQSEKASQTIADFITANRLSEAEINSVVNALRTQQQTLAVNSTEYNNTKNAITNLGAATNLLQKNQAIANATSIQMAPSFGQARAGLMQLGYVVQDSSMFFVNFRMGMMSVANNIPFIIQGFMALKESANELKVTMGSALKQALIGPTGVLLAVNAVMLAMTVLPKLFDNGTESIKKQKDEVKRLTDEYKNLSTAIIETKIAEVKTELSKYDLNQRRLKAEKEANITKPALSMSGSAGTNFHITSTLNTAYSFSTGDQEVIDKLNSQLSALEGLLNKKKKVLSDYYSGKYKPLNIDETKDLISLITAERDSSKSDSERNIYNSTIKNLEKIQGAWEGHTDKQKNVSGKLKEEQEKLWYELNKMSKSGEDLELYELDEWYKDSIKTMQGNNDGMLKVNEVYEQKRLAIRKEYNELINDLDKQFANDQDLTLRERMKKYKDVGLEGIVEYKKDPELTPAETLRRQKEEVENWKQVNQEAVASVDAVRSASETMWQQFIVGSRQAKDGWDAVWLSFRNTALNRLFEIVSNNIWDQLFSKMSAQGSSSSDSGGNWLTSILSWIPALFATGGVVTSPRLGIVGEAGPEAIIPLSQLPSIISRSGNMDLSPVINKLDNVAQSMQKIKLEMEIKDDSIYISNKRAIKRRNDFGY